MYDQDFTKIIIAAAATLLNVIVIIIVTIFMMMESKESQKEFLTSVTLTSIKILPRKMIGFPKKSTVLLSEQLLYSRWVCF